MTAHASKRPKLGVCDLESDLANCSARPSIRRTRTSVLPRYSVDLRATNAPLDEDDRADALIEYVIAPSWNACRVSPLFNFEYAVPALKRNAAKLKELLKRSVKFDADGNYKLEINIVRNLKFETDDPNALQITLSHSVNDATKNIYEGLLFSWGCFSAQKYPKVVHLPLLLDRGQAKFTSAIRSGLMTVFDCTVSPLHFKQTELILFSALLSSLSNKNGTKEVNFVYNVPHTRNKTKLNIFMSAQDINNMWLDSFPDSCEPSELYEEKSLKWYSAFQNYIRYVYELDIAQLELTDLKYPDMNIQNKGKIQFRDLETAKYALKILCEMSVILKGSVPTLGSDY